MPYGDNAPDQLKYQLFNNGYIGPATNAELKKISRFHDEILGFIASRIKHEFMISSHDV